MVSIAERAPGCCRLRTFAVGASNNLRWVGLAQIDAADPEDEILALPSTTLRFLLVLASTSCNVLFEVSAVPDCSTANCATVVPIAILPGNKRTREPETTVLKIDELPSDTTSE